MPKASMMLYGGQFRLFAMPKRSNAPALTTWEYHRRYIRKPTKGIVEFKWTKKIPAKIWAMVLSKDALFAAGVRTGKVADGGEQSSFVLMSVRTKDGAVAHELPLEAAPVWDGMAAAHTKLFVSLKDGQLTCVGAHTSASARPTEER